MFSSPPGGMLLSMLQTKKVDGLPLCERIERSSMPVTECGCWIWLKSGTRLGYGQINIKGKMIAAHRAAWSAYRGEIPAGMHVLHSCDIPSCVNPDHLSLGTRSQNMLESARKGRRRSGLWNWSSSSVTSSRRLQRVGFTMRERIERGSIPVTECGCWLWMGTMRLGYGRITVWPSRKTFSAHRIAYEAFVGAIPPGLMVLHRCDIPSCVNPDHLFLGTQNENMADRRRKNRYASVAGSAHPGAKLNEQQVIEIRASSEPARVLASRYSVSIPLIAAVRQRRVWRHI